MSEIRSQATPARDELAEKIERWLTSADKIASTGYSHQKVRLCESMGFDWHETIAALQKALPRTVNSVEELRELPVGSVVKSKIAIYQKFRTWWAISGDSREFPVQSVPLPATVLFTPGDAG